MGSPLHINPDLIKHGIQKLQSAKDATPEEVRKRYFSDPLGFVMAEWPWGEVGGPLENDTGPDDYQAGFLSDLGKHIKDRNFDGHTAVDPIYMSISSANGCGKSSLGAMLCWFILRTRKYSVGTVTSGNFQQLEERIWADIMHWAQISRGAQYFEIMRSGIFHIDPLYREKWKVTPKTAAKDRSHSFAGQHSKNSTSFFVIDESSEVHDDIWKEMYTGLTDGEPMFFAWGQMLKNHGEFYNRTFGSNTEGWDFRVFDGRKSRFTNKKFIEEWKKEYGEDSDYYRVHALGLAPRASSLQFIGQEVIEKAKARDHRPLPDEPLIWGYDAANGGLAKHLFWARRGLDAKTILPLSFPGDTPRDVIVAKAAELMSDRRPGHRAAAMFVDQAFGAVICARLQALGYTNVFEVNFGDPSVDEHFLNRRAQMWATMKEWLNLGAIPDDEKLAQQFMGPGFHFTPSGKLVLESKENMAKRGIKSPDGPDALCLTFAQRVAIAPPPPPLRAPIYRPRGSMGWAR